MINKMDKETLYRFFEGKATPEQESEIRAWMESSDENGKEFFRERKLFDAIVLLGKQDKEVTENKRPFYTRIPVRELLKIAAVIVFTLSATLFIQNKILSDDRVAMNIVSVPAGQRVNLTLPDGTNLWLNACSTLKYPAVFTKNKREIILDGEAYFEVAHNKKKPFIVHTGKCDVEVLGTKFNVEAYSNKSKFETSLMEGSVKVSLASNNAESLVLAPDNRAYLEGGKLVSAKIEDYGNYRWKEGLICFKNLPFSDVMLKLEKYFDIRIIINNKKVRSCILTGKFRQADGIDYALKVLQKDVYFNFKRSENNDVIYIY